MSEFDAAPDACAPRDAAARWLREQAALDWRSAGLPPFDDWDPALAVLSRLVAASPAPMALLMGPRGVLLANEAASRQFATRARGPVNGRSVLDVLPDATAFYESVLEQTLRGAALTLERQPVRFGLDADAPMHWLTFDFTPVAGRDGEIVGALGVVSDVTSLMRRIRALSESEQRLRVALESSGMVGIWTLDVATWTSTADASVARMFGLAETACAEGVPDSLFVAAVHPEDRERIRAPLAEAIASGAPYRNRYRVLDGTGQVHWVVTSAKPVLDDKGKVGRMLGVVVDVTGQMETASALAESRFQFQTLTETLPQIVWSCDGDGRHDYFSARWSEFTGIEQADITEETWKLLIYPEHQAKVASVWGQSMRSGDAYDIDYRFRHRSGEYRWLRVMALPMRDDAGRVVRWFGTSTDVHESYMVADERAALARELERIATEDQLTGTLTRRAFVERATRELGLDRPQTESFSVLMLDIDHFKAINDGYGHPVGDKVLEATARRILSGIRLQDFVGRLGGEEFAAFLPHCTLPQARIIAERIRRSVAESPVALTDGRRVDVTVSIGAACARICGGRLDEALTAADRALYAAKAAGRNRTSHVAV